MNNIVLSPIPLTELEVLIDNAVTRAIKRQQPKTDTQAPGYITRAGVCARLHISLPTLHAWIKRGEIKAYHVGGRTLFKESEISESVKAVSYSIGSDIKKKEGKL